MRERERPGNGVDGGSRRPVSAPRDPGTASGPGDRARPHRDDQRSRRERLTGRLRRWKSRRVLLGVGGAAIILATFAYFLPKIADYRDVWDVVKALSWPWLLALIAATVVNLSTFAPPWMVALPGLRLWPAFWLTQATTAMSIVMPAGAAVGVATSYGMLRSLGFPGRDIGRAITMTSLWNQFANLLYPIAALFLLTATGGDSPLLATTAFVGVAVFGVAVGGLVVVLASDRTATDVGDLAARLANWTLGKVRRGPVWWGGTNFERFRRHAIHLLRRRWHVLTLSTLAGSLSVFGVLLVSLRALDVPASEVTVVEAFAAWALMRLIGSIPITPGGIGIIELGLTAALIGFGGNNAGVVAAVLVYRFLTMVPTLTLGLVSAATWRRHSRVSVEVP
jgi:putative heme transporter